MTSFTQAAAAFFPGMLRFGPLHLPVYGLFAAAALIAALWLSQRSAPRAGLPADKLWDAGIFAVVAAFLCSRLLLVLFDLRAFLHYPLLVLSLPSLTYTGMLLTALLLWGYLRRQGLPTLRVLDAWSPCAALLASILSLGHFVEGTNAGMPTSFPWGVHTPGDSVLGRVHPVQLYALALFLALAAVLFHRLTQQRRPGETAALGLAAGGLFSFVLDMLRQPAETFSPNPLEASQVVALAAMLTGVWLWWPASQPALSPSPAPASTTQETA